MSSSVWYEMGIRKGKFRGVVPVHFLDKACRFFSSLREECRKSLSPEYAAGEKESTFSNKDKSGAWQVNSGNLWRLFSYEGNISGKPVPPLGTPVPEELWSGDPPDWSKNFFSEEEILGEKVIPHPLDNNRGGGRFLRTPIGWEQQRYWLIQKMRFCIVPLKITWCSSFDNVWYEHSGGYAGERGFINSDAFNWEGRKYLRLTFPDFFLQGACCCKIALAAEKISGKKVPIEGKRWITGFPFTTAAPPGDESWDGISKLRVYGIADLSTHPGFASYFDF